MPTEDELKRDAVTIDFEIWMLMETSARLSGNLPRPVDKISNNALLESWLVHLRALLEFFRTGYRGPNKDDVRAEDYFTEKNLEIKKIRSLAPNPKSREEKRKKEIDKLLMHIVKDRSRFYSRWSARDNEMVTSRLKIFFKILEPSRRAWFPKAGPWFTSL